LVLVRALGIVVTAGALRTAETAVYAEVREKTAVLASDVSTAPIDGKDVLLTLVVQDSAVPAPGQLRINGHAPIRFDGTWFGDIDRNVAAVWDDYLQALSTEKSDGFEVEYQEGRPAYWAVNPS
jgi:hypothetical protein